jgi:signal transduction histidine kinase
MAGPSWSSGGSLRNYQEVATIQGVFTACQDVLEREGPAVQDLLDEVRLALRAEHVFLLTERGAEVEVAASPRDRWPDRLPREAAALLRPSDQAGLDPEVLHRLTLELGVPSRSVVGGQGRESGRVEVLVAGWSDGLMLSPVSMTVVARAVSTARAALRGRGEAVTTQVDRERTRMAYALHDGVIQTVASAVLELEALRKRFERDPARALATLEHSKTEIRRSLSELRAILAGLSKEPQDERPEPLTRYVDDVVRRWRLPAQVSVEGDVNDVPARILSVAYVVIREALANAAKHASTGHVSVTLAARDGELEVLVDDGGKGFTEADEQQARQAHHFGLDMLRRRVREVGGELLVDSAPGKGTRVLARLPVSEVSP